MELCRKRRAVSGCSTPRAKRPLSRPHHPDSRTGGSSYRLPARAESSLGFTSAGRREDKPLGFDLAKYIASTGSSAGITIGVNGRTSTDGYFTNYMKHCEQSVQTTATAELSDCDVEDIEQVNVVCGALKQETIKVVPLCWEDQFKNEPEAPVTEQASRRAKSGGLQSKDVKSLDTLHLVVPQATVAPASLPSEEHLPVPAQFTPKCFVRRKTYFNQDEDADRTDLQDLARNFPDLNFHGFPLPHQPAVYSTSSSVARSRKDRTLYRPKQQNISLRQSNYTSIVSMLHPYINKPHQ